MSNPEINQALAQLDRALTNPRELAKDAIQKFRLDRDRDSEKPLPVANQHEDEVRPTLLVNEVLLKSFKNIG